MIDRSPTPHRVIAARIGRTELGGATVVFDDDALVVIVGSADDQPVHVPFAVMEHVHREPAGLSILLRDGTRVEFAIDEHATFADELLGRCRAIPELTRTLRAFGSRRGGRGVRESGAHEQQRFFAPLLAARRSADRARDPFSALEAFDAARLTSEIDAIVASFAAARFGANAPARRALHAELFDAGEPLREVLAELARVAASAQSAADDLRAWRAWANQLRAVFETADRAWRVLDAALDRGGVPR